MAQETLPAEFAKGTKVVRITGSWDTINTITEGVITRTTKTLAIVTFTHEDGREHERRYKYVRPGSFDKDRELRLTDADGAKYRNRGDDLYLEGASAVAVAHKRNARVHASVKAVNAARNYSNTSAKWTTRESVEELIAELTSTLEHLPTRAEL